VRLPRALIVVAAVAATVLGSLLMLLAGDGAPFGWDRAIQHAMRAGGDAAGLRGAMVAFTALGDGAVLTGVVAGVAGLLLVLGRRGTAATVVLATASGGVVAALAKLLVARPRPDIAGRLVEVSGLSFPSGHAMNSAIIYLTLASLVTHVERGRQVRRYTLAVAMLLVGTIGASRVYLGVHWPSDVLAGWCAGTVWAIGWWWVAQLRGVRPAR
jgi:undecaprenyl-diphosphatase